MPAFIHSKNGCSPPAAEGVGNVLIPSSASCRSVRRDRPRAFQAGGESIATICGRRSRSTVATSSSEARAWVSTTARPSFITTRSSPLRSPPTSTPRTRTGMSGRGSPAMRQEIEQVAAGQDSEYLTGLGDEHGGLLLELGEGLLDRVVELHHGDRWRHHLGDVGLERVRVAEDAVEQLPLTDRPDEAADLRALLADDRSLRDRVLLQQVDGLADLVVRPDGHERREGATLRGQHLLDAD